MIALALFFSCLTSSFCSYSFSNYDLSSLTRSTDDPYCTNITDKGIELAFNVYDIITGYNGSTLDASVDCTAAYFISGLLICQATNSTATHTFSDDGKTITSTYLVSGTLRYQLVLQCADSESYSASQPATIITVTFNTPHACPSSSSSGSGGLSFGSIVLIIILALIVLYFAVGIPVMHFVFKKNGIEMIPFVHFWMMIPGLVLDGCKFILSFIPIFKKKEGYSEVA